MSPDSFMVINFHKYNHYFPISGLITAIAWPVSLLGFASVIDNPWGVCLRRSAQVGKQLAEVLLSRSQGHRPVTLLGYSLGARVIYYCLRVGLLDLIKIIYLVREYRNVKNDSDKEVEKK